jgi:hypothetical protein
LLTQDFGFVRESSRPRLAGDDVTRNFASPAFAPNVFSSREIS